MSRREQATHSGGCGFCIGLGTTLRGGIFTYSPSTPVKGTSTMQRMATSSPSSHCSRLMRGSMPKPASSASLDDSPEPNSTRPLDTRSSIATRSAVRAGWLKPGAVRMIPWPRRMCCVRWLQAARKTSGADEWLYSSRKWCSTSHRNWIPRRSASSTCSSASWMRRCSPSASHGRPIWCS